MHLLTCKSHTVQRVTLKFKEVFEVSTTYPQGPKTAPPTLFFFFFKDEFNLGSGVRHFLPLDWTPHFSHPLKFL